MKVSFTQGSGKYSVPVTSFKQISPPTSRGSKVWQRPNVIRWQQTLNEAFSRSMVIWTASLPTPYRPTHAETSDQQRGGREGSVLINYRIEQAGWQ
jgi:hypothetical protein